MEFPRTWLRPLKSKFYKSPGRDPIDLIPSCSRLSTMVLVQEEGDNEGFVEPPQDLNRPNISAKDRAAIRIQAYFSGQLARRAFRALRSLVKPQAMARGAYVRKQARIVRCMEVIVRLQVRIHVRQLLGDVR